MLLGPCWWKVRERSATPRWSVPIATQQEFLPSPVGLQTQQWTVTLRCICLRMHGRHMHCKTYALQKYAWQTYALHTYALQDICIADICMADLCIVHICTADICTNRIKHIQCRCMHRRTFASLCAPADTAMDSELACMAHSCAAKICIAGL